MLIGALGANTCVSASPTSSKLKSYAYAAFAVIFLAIFVFGFIFIGMSGMALILRIVWGLS